jgi:hypothetical protein
MNYRQATGRTIKSSFDEFHQSNPVVYSHFKRLALLAIGKGKNKISSKMICNVIRWEIYIQTESPDLFTIEGKERKFRINDAFTCFYGRLFAEDFPEHKDKLEFRRLRAAGVDTL